MASTPLKLVLVGHVDHGKSTLVGRLLHETNSLPDGRVESLKAAAARRGVAFEWSFALDTMQAERDQAVTIETTRLWLRLPNRPVLLIDAPGHREFIAKMMTGATAADCALLIVDATEGIQDQTRRHIHLLGLLGIRTVIVAVNKMDLIGFDHTRFDARAEEVCSSLAAAGLAAGAVVPVVAPDGDNLMRRSDRMAWYDGKTIAELLARLPASELPDGLPLRLPIQDVYRIDQRRLYVGRVESGRISVGDQILFSPSNKVAHVQSIEIWPMKLPAAEAGRSIGIELDRPLFVERGEIVSHVDRAPRLNRRFPATIVWLSGRPLTVGQSLRVQLGTVDAPVIIESIEKILDIGRSTTRLGNALERDEIADVTFHSPRLLALDDARLIPRIGRFVLRDGTDVAGGGLIRLSGVADLRPVTSATALSPVDHRVTSELRAQRTGHRGGVLWLTGLSGAGKSTLAMAVEEHLFRKGYAVYVLDGDNVRGGLNADLGFSPTDRVENIRRVGHLAALFADAGFICITAFISPYATDRAQARAAAGAAFHEIYVNADIATCERRDPKGLYKRARAGELAEFTGVSSPYEPPEAPELAIDTVRQPIETSVEQVVDYVERNFVLRERAR